MFWGVKFIFDSCVFILYIFKGVKILLEVSNISFSYPNLKALDNLSMKVDKNKVVSVIGKRHSGKTTLFKIIAGLIIPDSGNIIYNGKSILRHRHKFLNSEIVCIEGYSGLFLGMTVQENIELGAWHIKDKFLLKKRFDETLDLAPYLKKNCRKNADKLDDGEKMLTIIARAIISLPKLVVIDEPTFGLYPDFVDKVLDLIHRANKDLNITFLLMQKKVSAAIRVSDWIYELEDGEIIKVGDRKSFEKFDSTLASF